VAGSTGQIATKAEGIQQLRSQEGQPLAAPGLNTNLRVMIVGDAALLTVDYQLDGGPPSHSARVFVKRNGTWQQVIHQQTPVPVLRQY